MENKEQNLKVTLNMDGLSDVITEAVQNNLSAVIEKVIADTIKHDDNIEELIRKNVAEKVNTMVDEYFANYKVVISSWGEDPKEYTVQEYCKKLVTDFISSGRAIEYRGEAYTVKQYLDNQIDRNSIRNQIENYGTQIRKDISNQIKQTFDSATMSALSSGMVEVLMNNKTYKDMCSGIAAIATSEKKSE